MAEGFLSRRQFVAGSAALAMAGMFGALTGCTAGGSGAAAGADTASASAGGDAASSTDPITMVWLPDNSSADLCASREALGAASPAACGRAASRLTPTDSDVANSIGAVYKAKDDAEAPVDSVRGKEFTIIAITPVLNSPICFNEEAISDDDRTKIIDYFCSDKVANDKAIFIDPEDENAKGLFEKDSEKTCFVKTDDAWYEPIRKLGGTA